MSAPPPYDVRYLEGIRRHNAREFYEAHEYLEDLWHEWGPPQKTLLQALIQFTVACLHLEMKNPRGATTMSGRVIKQLASLPDELWGLDLRMIEKNAREFFAPLHDPGLLAQRGPPDPAQAPGWGWPANAPPDYDRPPMPEKPE